MAASWWVGRLGNILRTSVKLHLHWRMRSRRETLMAAWLGSFIRGMAEMTPMAWRCSLREAPGVVTTAPALF